MTATLQAVKNGKSALANEITLAARSQRRYKMHRAARLGRPSAATPPPRPPNGALIRATSGLHRLPNSNDTDGSLGENIFHLSQGPPQGRYGCERLSLGRAMTQQIAPVYAAHVCRDPSRPGHGQIGMGRAARRKVSVWREFHSARRKWPEYRPLERLSVSVGVLLSRERSLNSHQPLG